MYPLEQMLGRRPCRFGLSNACCHRGRPATFPSLPGPCVVVAVRVALEGSKNDGFGLAVENGERLELVVVADTSEDQSSRSLSEVLDQTRTMLSTGQLFCLQPSEVDDGLRRPDLAGRFGEVERSKR